MGWCCGIFPRQPFYKLFQIQLTTAVVVHVIEQPMQIFLGQFCNGKFGIFSDCTSKLLVIQSATVVFIVMMKKFGPIDSTNCIGGRLQFGFDHFLTLIDQFWFASRSTMVVVVVVVIGATAVIGVIGAIVVVVVVEVIVVVLLRMGTVLG